MWKKHCLCTMSGIGLWQTEFKTRWQILNIFQKLMDKVHNVWKYCHWNHYLFVTPLTWPHNDTNWNPRSCKLNAFVWAVYIPHMGMLQNKWKTVCIISVRNDGIEKWCQTVKETLPMVMYIIIYVFAICEEATEITTCGTVPIRIIRTVKSQRVLSWQEVARYEIWDMDIQYCTCSIVLHTVSF